MNVTLLILDGLLVLILLVGWIEATAFSKYRFNFGRFVRASSLPLGIGLALHGLDFASGGTGLDWYLLWEQTKPSIWTVLLFIGYLAFIIFAPVLILKITGFVAAQFTASSGVTTVVLGDGDVVFSVPVETNRSSAEAILASLKVEESERDAPKAEATDQNPVGPS